MNDRRNFCLVVVLAKFVAKKLLPEFVAPMMASTVKKPFNDPDWIFETKLDGYRGIAVIDPNGKARLWSRNHLPLEPKFLTIHEAINQLNLRSTILDGEIVALDKERRTHVSAIATMAETSDRSGRLLSFRPALARWA